MFFQLREVLRWLGLTVFEIWIALVCFTVFTVLVTLKVEQVADSSLTWWLVFSPLFVSDALNAYFCVIVFIRMCLEVKMLIFSTAIQKCQLTHFINLPGHVQSSTRSGSLEPYYDLVAVRVQVFALPETQRRKFKIGIFRGYVSNLHSASVGHG